jgi:hypothetical protein
MFDAAEWITALEQLLKRHAARPETDVAYFHQEIVAPLSNDDYEALALDLTIPEVLLDFWHRGATSIDCGFVIRPSTKNDRAFKTLFPDAMKIAVGVNFLSPEESASCTEDLRNKEFALRRNASESEKEHNRLWTECIAVSHLGNGDYLAIDPSTGSADPPVAYLTHEESSSSVVCRSFSMFMKFWQEWCFLHPFYLPFPVEKSSGSLAVQQNRIALLQSIFDA